MSEQWQIRRGTTAENNSFTGAEGEITMDTDKKQLRVHDGQTQGGAGMIDPIVAFQVPTAENNYTWYRKYRSGWVEQGGLLNINTSAGGTVVLPVTMSTSYYNIFIQTAISGTQAVIYTNRTTTSFDYSGNVGKDSWYVCGMAA